MSKTKIHLAAPHGDYFSRHPHVYQFLMILFYVLFVMLASMTIAVLA